MSRFRVPTLQTLRSFLYRASIWITTQIDKVSGLHGSLPLEPLPRVDEAESVPVSIPDAPASNFTEWKTAGAEAHPSCSWRRTTCLLMAEFIGAAIMSFPAAFAEMGICLAFAVVFFIGITYCYTSHVLWRFCLRHKEVRDVCDIGRLLFGPCGTFGYWFTVVMFVLNNILVMGVHVQLSGELLQALMDGFSVPFSPTLVGCLIGAFCCFCFSLPPSLAYHAKAAFLAVACTVLGICMTVISAGIQYRATNSADGLSDGPPAVSLWPKPVASLQSIMVAFLNIAFALVSQITFPSFIAEMKEPRDFPKALHASMVVQYSIFLGFGLSVYSFIGGQYIKSPAVNSLSGTRKQLISGFFAPTVIFLGSLYAAVTARFVLVCLFDKEHKHVTSHTVKGWLTRISLLAFFWVLAWIVSYGMPSFSTLLAIVGAIFAAIFGYIFWGIAWFWMQNADLRRIRRAWRHRGNILGIAINAFLIIVGGCLFLVIGTWASIDQMLRVKASEPFSF